MSNIEWTDVTWNPVVGCTPVSPGCLNCYAATMARRLEGMGVAGYAPREVPATMGTPYDSWEPAKTIRIAEVRGGRAVFTGDVRTVPDQLTEPLHWRKSRRVFVNSMSDLFHEAVPFEFIDRVFAVMALCPQHTFQVLTKRPERMAEYTNDPGRLTMVAQAAALLGHGEASMHIEMPLPGVWLGTSVEDQARADERIPHLLRCPAAVRFLSVEPLLEAVDLVSALAFGCADAHDVRRRGVRGDPFVDWVIVGGESGKARPCDVAWVRSVVTQCRDAGVPCFVKQLGAKPTGHAQWHHEENQGHGINIADYRLSDRKGGDPDEWPDDLRVREMPEAMRVGK